MVFEDSNCAASLRWTYFTTCTGVFVYLETKTSQKFALQGECAARIRPSGQQDGGFSNTIQDFIKHGEGIHYIMMLSFQGVLQIHTQLVRQTDKHTPKHTFTLNQLLNKTSTVMNIVLHLNMKNPLWQDILYWVWSTTSLCFNFHLPVKVGRFALCISAWCVCDSLFSFHSCHVLINKIHTQNTVDWFLFYLGG